MKTIKFSDKDGPRSRKSKLLVNPEGAAPFWWGGAEQDGLRVISRQFKKNGKWSGTDFVLEIEETILDAIPVRQGFETGKWREGIATAINLPPTATWEEIAATLGCEIGDLVDETSIVIPTGPSRVETEID